jgi:hypothetical protein
VDRALPGRGPRLRAGHGPGGPLRAARGCRARVHRGAPAPAAAPARGADPPRRARLLGRGGRRCPRHDARVGLERAPARPQSGRRAASGAEPAGHAPDARRRGAARDRAPLCGRLGAGRRRCGCGDADRRRDDRHAAISTWYSGRDAVAGFLRGWPLSGEPRWRLLAVGANGQPAFGHYLWDGATSRFRPHSINLLTLRSGRISDLTAFLTPEAFSRFGLPDRTEM